MIWKSYLNDDVYVSVSQRRFAFEAPTVKFCFCPGAPPFSISMSRFPAQLGHGNALVTSPIHSRLLTILQDLQSLGWGSRLVQATSMQPQSNFTCEYTSLHIVQVLKAGY